jgi:hypothetical protein
MFMYSRRALFLACIALALTNVESAKVPSSPTAVLKKRASTTTTVTTTARMASSTFDTTNDATVISSQISADSIRYVGYIDAD